MDFQFGLITVEITVINLARRRIYGHELGKYVAHTFFLSSKPNYNLDLLITNLEPGNIVTIGYEIKQHGEYQHKFVRCIIH
jgi:hypothetical protein